MAIYSTDNPKKSMQPGRLLFFAIVILNLSWAGQLLAQPSVSANGTSSSSNTRPTDRIIVKYKNGMFQSGARGLPQAALNAMNANARERLLYLRQMNSGAHVFKLSRFQSLADVQAMADRIKNDPAVEFAEPDILLQTTFEPNDPLYSQYQWHYSEITGGINLPQAWDISNGNGAVVAVIDTGYLPHADLENNILPGYDMISDAFVSRDGDGRDADPTDAGDWTGQGECGNGFPTQDVNSSWHGTHVSGTIAAETNNARGVAGVAFGAKILPIRALGRCGGYSSDIADAIIWAAGGNVSGVPANTNPAQVLNLSFGGSAACGFSFQNAINTAHNLGATIVVAAGNSQTDASSFTPANCNNVVVVAATDRNGDRAYYSNFGNNVDVAAPGGNTTVNGGLDGVLSTLNNGQTIANSDIYAFYQGTSMATPHVSGVAALLYSNNPGITPNDVETIIRQTAREFPGTCSQCGSGIVDAYAALTYESGGNGESTELENGVAVLNLSAVTGEELRFTLTVPDGAGNLSFVLSGGTGDADLYIEFESNPTPNSFDCGSYQLGSSETCYMGNGEVGIYHVLVHAYSNFSGVSLLASYDENSGTTETFSVSNLSGYWFSWKYYFVEIPEGTESLSINTFGGTGDADLYLRYGALPNTGNYNCSSLSLSTVENCTITNPTPGTWYIGVRAALFYSGVSMSVQYTY